MKSVRSGSCLILLGIIVASCEATAPEVRVIEPLPQGTDPAIYVTAARHKEEIVRSLRAVGFRIADEPVESQYLLRVTVGIDQNTQACGTLNNVRYALRTEGRTLVEAVAKGWTGTCEPNVFNVVSRELRGRIIDMIGEGQK